MQHVPVLLTEVMEILDPKEGEQVLDCTVGLGGHAAGFLKKIGTKGHLTGIDADETNLNRARENLKEFQNVELVQRNFKEFFLNPPSLCPLPQGRGSPPTMFDIIFADLGLSSPHLDDPERGFTYREDAPLDMRFDRSQGKTVAELIEQCSEKELANILFHFGELRESRRLAHAIKQTSMRTTWDLKTCLEGVFGWRAKKMLPQIFQALRIAVNDELEALATLLQEGSQMLRPEGRMGIISFHSLEDRMVKQRFKELCLSPKDPVTGQDTMRAEFELLTKRPICPLKSEIQENPRSRSAKFRAIKRLPF